MMNWIGTKRNGTELKEDDICNIKKLDPTNQETPGQRERRRQRGTRMLVALILIALTLIGVCVLMYFMHTGKLDGKNNTEPENKTTDMQQAQER